jgi:hypothetical protein
MRAQVLILVLAALAVVGGSFGVAAAGERKQPIEFMSEEDCGCTGGARAKDRIQQGLIPTTPAEQSSSQR